MLACARGLGSGQEARGADATACVTGSALGRPPSGRWQSPDGSRATKAGPQGWGDGPRAAVSLLLSGQRRRDGCVGRGAGLDAAGAWPLGGSRPARWAQRPTSVRRADGPISSARGHRGQAIQTQALPPRLPERLHTQAPTLLLGALGSRQVRRQESPLCRLSPAHSSGLAGLHPHPPHCPCSLLVAWLESLCRKLPPLLCDPRSS